MVLHQSKVGLVVPLQTIVEECYLKKLCKPRSVYSDSTPVFGLVTLNVCSSLGDVSKNACIFPTVNLSNSLQIVRILSW